MHKFLVIIGYVDLGSDVAQVRHVVISAESREEARAGAWRSLGDPEWTRTHVADFSDIDDGEYDLVRDVGVDYLEVVGIDDINDAAVVPTLPQLVDPKHALASE